jgi:hypothetical protein
VKNTLKSIWAVLAGIIAVFALSIITDIILEKTGIMKLPFDDNSFSFIVFVIVYRSLYVVIGSYVTASLAPIKPMKHSIIYAAIGFVLGVLGTVAMWHLPPHWYPISLVILGIPSALWGGKLKEAHLKKSRSLLK